MVISILAGVVHQHFKRKPYYRGRKRKKFSITIGCNMPKETSQRSSPQYSTDVVGTLNKQTRNVGRVFLCCISEFQRYMLFYFACLDFLVYINISMVQSVSTARRPIVITYLTESQTVNIHKKRLNGNKLRGGLAVLEKTLQPCPLLFK